MAAAALACLLTCLLAALPTACIILGDECKNYSDCATIANAACAQTRRCECKLGYSALNKTACAKLIGDPCDNSSSCDTLDSICLWRGLCGCRTGMKHNSNYTFCYATPEKYEDLCDFSNECKFLGAAGECIDGRCLCQQFSGCKRTQATPRPARLLPCVGDGCRPSEDPPAAGSTAASAALEQLPPPPPPPSPEAEHNGHVAEDNYAETRRQRRPKEDRSAPVHLTILSTHPPSSSLLHFLRSFRCCSLSAINNH
ncbi:uncharacterized protein GBIM_08173, partial [Gryllus bimaculatus]